MYIKHLELSNFQVIEKFEGNFEGNVYIVTGDNELGKSTLLKAIGALLTGERDDVLRNGTEKGYAKMVVGDEGEEFDVELKFTEKNPRGTITIRQKSSGMQTDNISMLQRIFGYQDFDAVEFSRWSETAEGRRKQIALVKALLPESVTKRIDEIDAKVYELKSERTGVNRDVKTFQALVKEAEKGLPEDKSRFSKPIDISALIEKQKQNAAQIEKAKNIRETKAQRERQLNEIESRIDDAKANLESRISETDHRVELAKIAYEQAIKEAEKGRETAKLMYEKELENIDADKKDIQMRLDNCNKWLADYEKNNPEKDDTERELQEAKLHNDMVSQISIYNNKKNLYDEAIRKSQDMDKQITELTDERAKLISKSELPIAGLSFTEDGLTLNGIPFADGHVSDSQKMEVACRLIIASNPKIKVFRIARGESLGAKRLQTIVEIAKKYGYQGWIEEVVRGQEDMRVEEYVEK